VIDDLIERLNDLNCVGTDVQLTSGVVFGIDSDPKAKVTLILFDAAGTPRAVAKVARDQSVESALRAEHGALLDLASIPSPRRPTLPAPLMLERVRGRLTLVSTAVRGAPMSVRYYEPGHVSDPHKVARDFDRAGEWLADLRASTGSGSVEITPVSFTRLVQPVVDRYRSCIGWDSWEQELFLSLVRGADAVSGAMLPLSFVHGDFAIGNILLDGDAVSGVVDWECARANDAPFYDVFKLAASYSSYLDRAAADAHGNVVGHVGWRHARRMFGETEWGNLIGFMYGFYGEGWFPEVVRRYVSDQTARMGVPPQLARLFLPVFIAEQAAALDNPTYRTGYRHLLQVIASRRSGQGRGEMRRSA
jgi:hypothetical protein